MTVVFHLESADSQKLVSERIKLPIKLSGVVRSSPDISLGKLQRIWRLYLRDI